MKLNNKGFAASTVLYGILTVTIMLMMLILATMKSSIKMNNELVDQVENKLNNCIEDEMSLDICRVSKTTDCTSLQNAYKACLEDYSGNNE